MCVYVKETVYFYSTIISSKDSLWLILVIFHSRLILKTCTNPFINFSLQFVTVNKWTNRVPSMPEVGRSHNNLYSQEETDTTDNSLLQVCYKLKIFNKMVYKINSIYIEAQTFRLWLLVSVSKESMKQRKSYFVKILRFTHFF